MSKAHSACGTTIQNSQQSSAMAKINLVLVFVCLIAAARCSSIEENDSDSSEENKDLITLFRPVPVSGEEVAASDEDSEESDEEDSNEEDSNESDIEGLTLHRQKRGLGRRLKKLGRSVDRSFRKVRDNALPAVGVGLGAKLAGGAAAAAGR